MYIWFSYSITGGVPTRVGNIGAHIVAPWDLLLLLQLDVSECADAHTRLWSSTTSPEAEQKSSADCMVDSYYTAHYMNGRRWRVRESHRNVCCVVANDCWTWCWYHAGFTEKLTNNFFFGTESEEGGASCPEGEGGDGTGDKHARQVWNFKRKLEQEVNKLELDESDGSERLFMK